MTDLPLAQERTRSAIKVITNLTPSLWTQILKAVLSCAIKDGFLGSCQMDAAYCVFLIETQVCSLSQKQIPKLLMAPRTECSLRWGEASPSQNSLVDNSSTAGLTRGTALAKWMKRTRSCFLGLFSGHYRWCPKPISSSSQTAVRVDSSPNFTGLKCFCQRALRAREPHLFLSASK